MMSLKMDLIKEEFNLTLLTVELVSVLALGND